MTSTPNNPTNNSSTEHDEQPSITVKDRRFWQRSDNDEATSEDESRTKKDFAYVDQLKATIAKHEAEVNKFADALRVQREEHRKSMERLERHQSQEIENRTAALVTPLLEVGDNLQRIIESLTDENSSADMSATRSGIELVLNHFHCSLQALGIEQFSALNQPFDPTICEALSRQSTDQPELDNLVVEEYAQGYRIAERIIRPAKVSVAQHNNDEKGVETVTDASERD